MDYHLIIAAAPGIVALIIALTHSVVGIRGLQGPPGKDGKSIVGPAGPPGRDGKDAVVKPEDNKSNSESKDDHSKDTAKH